MNKKGVETLLINVIYLTIIGLILVIFISWIAGLSTGRITRAEMLSKQIALVIDSAEPETVVSITHEPGRIVIDTEKKEINVLIGQNGFTYDYFSKYRVSSQEANETMTIIKIEK